STFVTALPCWIAAIWSSCRPMYCLKKVDGSLLVWQSKKAPETRKALIAKRLIVRLHKSSSLFRRDNFPMSCCSPNRAINLARTPPYLAGDHDPGDPAHQYRYANQCSEGPDGTGGPLRKYQNRDGERGKGIDQEPSPSFNRSESERRNECHSSVNQKECSNEHRQRCYAFERKKCQCDADNPVQHA